MLKNIKNNKNIIITIFVSLFVFVLNLNINAIETTTIDLTGLVTGEDAEHTCIYVTKTDSSSHWEECLMCGTQKNKNTHSITRSWTQGYESCSYANYAVDICNTCGYEERYHKPCVWDGVSYVKYSSMSNNYNHVRQCSTCKSVIYYSFYLNGTYYEQDWTHQDCFYYENNQKIIPSCSVTGKSCYICGQAFNGRHLPLWPRHSFITSNDDLNTSSSQNLICGNCKKVFATSITTNTHSYSNGYWYSTLISKVTLESGIDLVSANAGSSTNTTWFDNTNFSYTTSTENGKVVITMTTTRRFKTTSITGTYFDDYQQIVLTPSDGNSYWFALYSGRGERPEYTAPIITSIVQTPNNSYNGWYIGETLTINGTEDHASYVNYSITNSNGNVVVSGKAIVTNKAFSFSINPEIEGNEIGQTYTLTISDAYGNKTSKDFVVTKVDIAPPTLVSNTDYTQEWSKTKEITIQSIDKGIGEVQIAFNSENNYELANFENEIYSRNYIFTGEVYDYVTGAIYLKDKLGNVTTELIKIGKLDNTKPTITDVTSKDDNSSQIYITGNDINSNLNKEGSGISHSCITKTNEKPNENDDIWINSTTIELNESGTFYVWVKDQAGNISESKEIKVENISYKDIIGDDISAILGETNLYKIVGTSISASSLGSDETENYYYNQYKYIGETTSTANKDICVYRKFAFITSSNSIAMNWNDNGNSANLRPEFVDLEIYKNSLLFKEIQIPATNYYVIEDLEKYDENGNEIVYS